MPHTKLFLLLLSLAIAGSAIGRVFKDPLGREIEAELISVEGDIVLLKKADGATIRTKRESFSKEDHVFFDAWVAENGNMPPAGTVAIFLEKGDDGEVAIEVVNRSDEALPVASLLVRSYTKPPGQAAYGPADSSISIPSLPAGKRAVSDSGQILEGRDWATAGEQIGGVLVRLVTGEEGKVIAEAKLETTEKGLANAVWPEPQKGGDGASAKITSPKAGELVQGTSFEVSGETQGVPEGYRCIITARRKAAGKLQPGMPRTFSFTPNRKFREEAKVRNLNNGSGFELLVFAVPDDHADVIDKWLGGVREEDRGEALAPEIWSKKIQLASIMIEVE